MYGNTENLNSQNNLEKNRAEGNMLPESRLYKAILTKTIWYWHKTDTDQ